MTPPIRAATPKTDAAIEQAIKRLVAHAPPLSEEQRQRLAQLLSTAAAQTGRDSA